MSDEPIESVNAPVEPAASVETTPTHETATDGSMTKEEFKASSSFLKQFQASQESGTEQKPVEQPTQESAAADNPDQSGVTPPEVSKEEPAAVEPPSPTVKLPDGRELTVEQITELEKGSMMQADYTKKTQALAEEKRLLQQERDAMGADKEQADKALQLYKAFERDPIGTIQQLSEYYDNQGIYEPKTPEQLALEDKQREIDAREQALNQKGQALIQQEQTTKFNQYMDGVAAKYEKEGFDKQLVADYMVKNSIYDAEAAWKVMSHDPKVESLQKQIDELNEKLKSAKNDGVAEYVKTKIDKSGTPPPLGASGASGVPPVQIKKPTTLRDAKLSALARLGAS